jgi:general secretion pathway protein E
MIGEIRDSETADIAIQAALTGHMVFSTIHTNDAAGAITRLVDMGVESFLISSALIGVLAQRLVRVICENCKEKIPLQPSFIKEMGKYADQGYTFEGKGCDKCTNTGYRGRKGLYELMVIDNDIRKLIVENASSHLIRASAQSKGMKILREDGWEKVLDGITTPEEVLRVTLDNEL